MADAGTRKPQEPQSDGEVRLAPTCYFPSVRKARVALKEKALEILEEYRSLIKQAAAAGKYEAALEAQRWLVDHIPADEGERLVDMSVDKPRQIEGGPKGPTIQVGIALGGIAHRRIQGGSPVIDGDVETDI